MAYEHVPRLCTLTFRDDTSLHDRRMVIDRLFRKYPAKYSKDVLELIDAYVYKQSFTVRVMRPEYLRLFKLATQELNDYVAISAAHLDNGV